MDLTPLPLAASDAERTARYKEVLRRIDALIADEHDPIAIMATVACELHHAFAYYDWTGFYRLTGPETLVIGPYQGGHGCLRIDLARGICGAAARTQTTQLVPDVHARPEHIACSSTTRSEIVVPLLTHATGPTPRTLAVLDVDSDTLRAFTSIDQRYLEQLCVRLAAAMC